METTQDLYCIDCGEVVPYIDHTKSSLQEHACRVVQRPDLVKKLVDYHLACEKGSYETGCFVFKNIDIPELLFAYQEYTSKK